MYVSHKEGQFRSLVGVYDMYVPITEANGIRSCFPDLIRVVFTKVFSSFICLLLFYAIGMVFQLYHGSDMMLGMRRRQPGPTL